MMGQTVEALIRDGVDGSSAAPSSGMIPAMKWTAPLVERQFDVYEGDERATLEAFLDWHRQTLLWKCSGLTAEQLRSANIEPSKLSLLGLLRHMTDVERIGFTTRVAGRPRDTVSWDLPGEDGDFDDLAAADAETDYARYVAESQRSREAVAGVSLEHRFQTHGRTMTLRWVYVHLIEEYARHNGHADLLRERIDGATGE